MRRQDDILRPERAAKTGCARVRPYWRLPRGACALGLVVIVLATPALAAPEQQFEGAQAVMVSALDDDTCIASLRAVRDATERQAQHQTHKASAAMLGLVFGVRYAIGPKELGTTRRPVAQLGPTQPQAGTDDGRARAISAWRRCINDRAIEARQASATRTTALNGARWSH